MAGDAVIVVALACFSVATCAVSYLVFRIGYSLGWNERHQDMILPRKVLERTNADLDDQTLRHRHGAIGPKKAVWH